MKRIFLFLVTNLAVMVLLGIVARVLGIDRFIGRSGLNLTHLMLFAAVFGMGGALISLFMSKWVAKMSVGAVAIETPSNETERWLVDTVRRQAQAAGIGMPEVALYEADEPNAFATGANRNAALVAVSTGLLQVMTRDEVEAVLGHEVSHVANGDMVTMSLLQGVLNTFVIVLSHAVSYVINQAVSSPNDRENHRTGITYTIMRAVLELVFGFLASLIVMAFSRYREFHADSGGANLAGRRKMIAALERLQQLHDQPAEMPSAVAAFGIRGGGGWAALLMTHPPLADRIAALRASD